MREGNNDMQGMIPLMVVPLLVWLAVWGYLWTLDMKVRKLAADVERQDSLPRGEGRGGVYAEGDRS